MHRDLDLSKGRVFEWEEGEHPIAKGLRDGQG